MSLSKTIFFDNLSMNLMIGVRVMMDERKKRLGERIRKARRDANLTQGELADKLRVSQGVISNVETGVSTIDAPDLPVWAEVLNKPIMYFYGDEDLARGASDWAI